MACVYFYEDPKTTIIRYVGAGNPDRPHAHLRKKTNPQLFTMTRKRIGEGFNVNPTVIVSEVSHNTSRAMEIFWIAVIGREDLGRGTLFNKTDGGEGVCGIIFSEESRERCRTASKKSLERPDVKAKISEGLRIANAKPEVKKKRSDSQRRANADSSLRQKKSQVMKVRLTDPSFKEQWCRDRMKKCTIDGITIFESRRDLIKRLGRGRAGLKNPGFRYV